MSVYVRNSFSESSTFSLIFYTLFYGEGYSVMNRQIICSLLSTFTGAFATPASANDNAIVAESRADAIARGLAIYYLDNGVASVIRVRRPKSRRNIFVPAVGHAARPLPVLRLLITRPR